MDPRTLTELYFGAMERFRDRPVFVRSRIGGAWVGVSYREHLDRVTRVAFALEHLGLPPGAHVGILSENRPEWGIIDYACLANRWVDVPIYPTLPANQIAYVLQDAGVQAICVSTREQLAKILEIRPELPALRHVVVFDGDAVDGTTPGLLRFTDLLATDAPEPAAVAAWRARALEATPDDLATLIYTSGTTGDPKGVMLTHGNITSNVTASCRALTTLPGDESISFLPLSHIFERMVGHYTALHLGAVINFAESFETLARDIAEVRPMTLAAVPRVFEKIYARAVETASRKGGIARRLFFWCKRWAEAVVTLRLAGTPVPWSMALRAWIADRVVFRTLRARLGGRVRFMVSGGAPLSPEVAKFFFAGGLVILEGYGLTETSPVISLNRPGAIRLGTVGLPLDNVEVRIAGDGEILCRGPNVMRGYYRQPAATAEVIDADGWFHTGDIGEIDDEGFLKITDRKKDLIVTAGGKNIAPLPIEGLLKTNPYIANAVMIGDRRPYPIVLLVPEFERVAAWARAAGLQAATPADLAEEPAVRRFLEGEAKKHFRDLARFEVPKRAVILPRDFQIALGEITPKLSIRRKVVERHFFDEIEAAYAEPNTGEQPRPQDGDAVAG